MPKPMALQPIPATVLKITVGAAAGVVLSSGLGFALPLSNGSVSNTNSTKNVPYMPPPDAGTPISTGGTGSRGCKANRELPNMVALVGHDHLLRTTSDRPTFWVYLPTTSAEASNGVLSIQLGDDEIYAGEFTLATTPGVVGVVLPDSAPPLLEGQEYTWLIDIECMATDISGSSDRTEVWGSVQRVAVSDNLMNDLENAQPGLETAIAYGKHHIWYDLLTEFARLRLETGTNAELETSWSELLSDTVNVGLTEWANEPLVWEVIAREEARTTTSSPPE
ncbi:MAG: DUF928 domain-containing protein [Leptolyngbyaceae cyanobacterium]